ncbi:MULTISPECIES: hypothetical protein [unclassified Trichocoleus]|uniref:hypothetical protein n=1 Tax=Funiculus sociatus TaxID=450527 RepID=UPI0018EF7DE3|nr:MULTISPECIES: hypothetical protein [unclassified Trichocoleus]
MQQAWSDRNDFFCGGKVRFYDEAGNLVLLPEEAERQRAEAAQQQVEAERQRAEAAQQQAEANANALLL